MVEFFRTLRAAVGLDARLYQHLGDVTTLTALAIAVLAGLSTMLGHIAILALNRIGGLRLVAALLLSSSALVVLYTSQAVVTWVLASAVLDRALPLRELVTVAMLALAPLVLNFITALPHLGLGIGRVLEAWSYLILWFGVGSAFDLSWYWALATTIAGWLVMQLLSRLGHRPIGWVIARAWRLATGRPTMVSSRDILAGMPIIPVEPRAAVTEGPDR